MGLEQQAIGLEQALEQDDGTAAGGLMERAESRDQVEWMSRAVGALRDDPALVGRLDELMETDDGEGFGQTLLAHWRDVDAVPPAAKCDPYVTAYIQVFRPPKYERRCEWISLATLDKVNDPHETYNIAGTLDEIQEVLLARGWLKCEWVQVQSGQVEVVKKFVNGICPPGT